MWLFWLRALTQIESSSPRHQPLAEELLTRLLPYTGQSIRVGITGVPGVGKSTFIEALGLYLVGRRLRVAVLAVDPSSGVSGGSILGDKTRMSRLSVHPAAYIRPSPAAGTLGGVARKTREAMLVCEAAGYNVVLIETVGVGQSETEVADMTDCFLALMLPGAGDELQGIKRGLLELVDVIAVNKTDGANQPAAELAAEQYRRALESIAGRHGDPPAVLTCSALQQERIDAVWDAVQRRHDRLAVSGELAERRRRQNLRWLWSLVEDQLRQAVHTHPAVQAMRADLERLSLDVLMSFHGQGRQDFSHRAAGLAHGPQRAFGPPAGAVIFRQRHDTPFIYFVLDGEVGLEFPVSPHEIVEVHRVGPGELLGWSPVLGRRSMTATARAVTPVRVAVIDVEPVVQLCASDPMFGTAFHRQVAVVLSSRLDDTHRRLSQHLPRRPVPAEGSD